MYDMSVKLIRNLIYWVEMGKTSGFGYLILFFSSILNILYFQIRCTAQIHNIYQQSIEKFIEEDRPISLATGPGYNMNLYQNQADGESNNDEVYLNHYKRKQFFFHYLLYTYKFLKDILLYTNLYKIFTREISVIQHNF